MQRIVSGDMPICKSRHAQVAATPVQAPGGFDYIASPDRPKRELDGSLLREREEASMRRIRNWKSSQRTDQEARRNQLKLICKLCAAATKINGRTRSSNRASERCSERVETARRRDSRGLESRDVAIAEISIARGRESSRSTRVRTPVDRFIRSLSPSAEIFTADREGALPKAARKESNRSPPPAIARGTIRNSRRVEDASERAGERANQAIYGNRRLRGSMNRYSNTA